MKLTIVGCVLSKVKLFHVIYDTLPAKSVAIILTLASVLSTTGNVRLYDPLLGAQFIIVECKVFQPSFEYCKTNGVAQKFISEPVVRVIVLFVPH